MKHLIDLYLLSSYVLWPSRAATVFLCGAFLVALCECVALAAHDE